MLRLLVLLQETVISDILHGSNNTKDAQNYNNN
jgi:hypothetical protein